MEFLLNFAVAGLPALGAWALIWAHMTRSVIRPRLVTPPETTSVFERHARGKRHFAEIEMEHFIRAA